MTGAELRHWLRGASVDPSVFGAAQPVYTATPVFAIGAADPLPHRLLLLPGTPEVAVPPPEALAPPPPPMLPPAIRTDAEAEAERRLAALIRFAAAAPRERRNVSLYWAACRAGELVAGGLVGAEAAAAALAEAGRQTGLSTSEAMATARSGVRTGAEGARRG